MTDPTGVCFFSYKRERAREAALVIRAMHEVGIPTWQDVTDLGSALTEDALERILSEPSTSSAVMFVTPEVEQSDMIRRVEVPAILRRAQRGDAFFALPVAAGGLDYDRVGPVLGPRTALVDMSSWNILKVASDPINAEDAARIAARTLDLRLAAIAAEPERDVTVRLLTREGISRNDGDVLNIDLRHLFEGRHALPGAWADTILPAMSTVAASLRHRLAGRPVSVCGNVALPAAVALGSMMPSLGGIDAGWLQEQAKFGRGSDRWSLRTPDGESGFEVDTISRSVTGTDLALLVSATNDVSDDFSLSSDGMPLRAVVHVRPAHPRPARVVLDGPAATHLAGLCVDAVRSAVARYGTRGAVHLFLAVPVGVAFMIGQQLNTLGEVVTYEHDPRASPPYRSAAIIHPSS